MNKTHRIVVNRRTGARQAVSETAKSSAGGPSSLGCALALGAALLGGALSPVAQAAGVQWVGNAGSWLDAANWVGGVPLAADDIELSGAGTASVSGIGSNAVGNYLLVGRDSAGSVSVTNGGNLTVARTFIGDVGASAIVVNGANSVFSTGGLLLGYVGQGTLTVGNGGTVRAGLIEFGAQPGGQGTLNLDAGGTLEIGGAGSLLPPPTAASTGVFNWSGGTLRVTGSALVTNMGATLSGTGAAGATIDTNGLGATLSGVLSGGGTLIKNGAGTLALTGVNTYTSGTTVNQGVLAVGNASALGTGALTIATGAELNGTASVTLGNANNFNNQTTLSAAPGKTLRLTGSTTVLGDLNIGSAGQTGIVELAATSGSIVTTGGLRVNLGTLRATGVYVPFLTDNVASVTVAAGARLDFNDTPSYSNGIRNLQGAGSVRTGAQVGTRLDVQAGDFSGVIEGAGSLMKNGAGVLTLRGVNTYGGATTIAGGTLALAGNGALPAGSALTVNAGTRFDVSAVTGPDATVASLASSGAVVLGTKSLRIGGNNASTTFSGSIGGSATSMLTKTGTGTQTLTAANTYGGGTIVSGGTLALTGAGSLAATGPMTVGSAGTFNIAGLAGAGTTIGALDGNGRVTLGGKTLTTGAAANTVFSGVIEGSGGLVKQGSGTLVLDGVNTFAGATGVTAGRLSVGSTAAASNARIAGAVNVSSGATLSGFGTVGGNATISGGARLAAGDPAAGNGIGTLRIGGDLTLADGSQLDFDLGAPSGQASVPGQGDSVSVGGNLAIGAATLNVRDAGGMGPGLYNLFKWGGALSITGGGFAPPAGTTLQVLTAGKQINLITSAGYTLNLWNGNGLASASQMGGGNGTWSATSPNWADASGTASGPLQPQPGFAIFGGAAGTVTVDNGGGAVLASGMQFASNGYTLSGGTLTLVADAGHPAPVEVRVGDGSADSANWRASIASVVAGTDGLAKTGSGTLALTGANTYTGGTALRGGTLEISADNNLGAASGGIDFDGGTLRIATGSAPMLSVRDIALGAAGGTVDVSSNLLGFTGTVSGKGGLRKTGAGELQLMAVNSYSGGTQIDAGTLNAGITGALGTGPVNVGGGAGLRFSGTADAGSLGIATAARDGIVNGGFVEFLDKSSAGSASIVTQTESSVTFRDNSTAGKASFENRGGSTTFWNNASGGSARITNFAGGSTNIWDDASAGQATIVNETGGVLDMQNQATADQATVVNNAGGKVSISKLTAAGTSVGSLEGAGAVSLGAKALTTGGLNTSTEVSGVISGTGGSIVKVGSGALTLSGANTYTGGTALRQGRLNVGHSQALGTGVLTMDDDTTLGFSADNLTIANAIRLTGQNDPIIDTGAFNGALSGGITGGGFITKEGTGTLTLSGTNTYSGLTNVAQGTLKAGAANTLSAVSAHSVAVGATLDLAGFSQTVASLNNSGTVSLAGAAAGSTLTVNGNYVGNNGVLKLGSALNGGAGPSDRLVINGGAASGKTTVQIANLGGLGAFTTGNGIEVITAQNGATTTAQTTRDAFALAGGRVDAGAYQYRLNAGDAAGAGENWYLRSDVPATTPPATPGVPALPVAPVTTYRAEASLYAALPSQLRQGNLAMLGDLRKRVGDDDVKGTATMPTGSDRRAWARVLSTDIDIRQGGTVSPTSKGRLTGVQAGTDLLAAPNWRAGLYVGQLDGDAAVNGFASGVRGLRTGRNDLRSQYVGVYGTYTGDSGLYADVVVQSGRHRYTVEPLQSIGTGGKGNSLLGSIEVGQAFALGASGWAIEPQLQLIHQHMDLGNSAIVGAVVQPQADNGWIARAGLRVKGQIDTGMGALQPYGRFNVYKTSGGADIARFVNGANTTDIAATTGGTSTELAGGFTLALGQTTSLYGEVGKLWAGGGNAKVKSSINGSLGVRVKW